MGESTIDAPFINQDKMGGVGGPALEVSISFGRFENDSLSWERWSSFSQNKYLEEVEKCATPGSVAMKKAYFEAHYKKIATKKAELMDQQAQIESDLSRSDEQGGEADLEPQTFDGQCSVEEIMERTSLFGEGSNSSIDEEPENEVEEENQLNCMLKNSPSLRNLEEEELVSVKEESPSVTTEETAAISHSINNEIKCTPNDKNEIVKQDLLKKVKQTTTANKVRNVARVAKKKPVSPLPAVRKRPQVSTPSVSRPTSLTSTLMSASRSSTKNATSSPLSTTKKSSIGERRKVVPSSIHMSVSLDARKSNSAPPVARKSLMMEQMADKDIVKRAFKTFQIQSNMSHSKPTKDNISPLPKQVLRKGAGLKESSLTTPKYKEGSHRAGGVQGRSAMTVSSPLISRSSDQTETRKKNLKKTDDKSNPKEADKTHLRSKSKEQKEADIKKLRQSLNFKAMPLPVFYRGQQTSKSLLEKNNSKNDTNH